MKSISLFICILIIGSDVWACDDLEEISWRDYKPCMSAGESKNWCKRKR